MTGRPEPSPPISVDTFGGLPAYSDISPPTGEVANKYEIIPTILRNLAPRGMSIVVLIPSDVLSLAAIERPSWDTSTSTGAANDEEVLSFPETPQKMKKVLRLPAGGDYTWDHVFGDEFQLEIREDLVEALEMGESFIRIAVIKEN